MANVIRQAIRPRKQGIEYVSILDIQIGQLLKQVLEVSERIEVILLRRFREAVGHRTGVRTARRAREEPGLSTHHERFNRPLAA